MIVIPRHKLLHQPQQKRKTETHNVASVFRLREVVEGVIELGEIQVRRKRVGKARPDMVKMTVGGGHSAGKKCEVTMASNIVRDNSCGIIQSSRRGSCTVDTTANERLPRSRRSTTVPPPAARALYEAIGRASRRFHFTLLGASHPRRSFSKLQAFEGWAWSYNAEEEQLSVVQAHPDAELVQRLVARPPDVVQRRICVGALSSR